MTRQTKSPIPCRAEPDNHEYVSNSWVFAALTFSLLLATVSPAPVLAVGACHEEFVGGASILALVTSLRARRKLALASCRARP